MKRWSNYVMASLVMGSLAFTVTPVGAWGVNDPYIQRREYNQQQRIDRGIQSGQLTRREARRLEAQQNRIQRVENRMKADGRLTGRERARLTRMQNRTSRNIYRLNHNYRRAR